MHIIRTSHLQNCVLCTITIGTVLTGASGTLLQLTQQLNNNGFTSTNFYGNQQPLEAIHGFDKSFGCLFYIIAVGNVILLTNETLTIARIGMLDE